jgi:hypothetical protein
MQTNWFATQFLGRGSYFQSMLSSFGNSGFLSGMLENFYFRLVEMGELIFNFPLSKFASLETFFLLIGLLGWLVLFFGFILLMKDGWIPLVLYTFFYIGLMGIWPFGDARFWIPLLPIFILSGLAVYKFTAGHFIWVRVIFKAWMCIYLVCGFASLFFSTQISMSGIRISEFYGDENTRMTYRMAFNNGLDVEPEKVHAGKVKILRLLEPLAQTRLQTSD